MFPRRIKRYPIDLSSLAQFFRALGDEMHPHYRFNGIPSDARIVDVRVDNGLLDRLYIFVESDTFDEVPEGALPPDEIITTTIWYCGEYQKAGLPR